MKDITTIQFRDIGSDDEAIIIVRAKVGSIALCISKEHDADLEVIFRSEECEKLLIALQEAITTATEEIA
jgi:hypothetical protein